MIERAREALNHIVSQRRRGQKEKGPSPLLSPIDAAVLTETILDFTQGTDALIPFFAFVYHHNNPDARIQYPNKETTNHIINRLTHRIDHHVHVGVTPESRADFTQRNFKSVKEVINREREFPPVSEDIISAGIVGILVSQDMSYLAGRPGDRSKPRYQFKSCTYIFEQNENRKKTPIPELNMTLDKAAAYIQTVSKEQFVQDYTYAARILWHSDIASPEIDVIGQMRTVIQKNNDVLGKTVTLPPCAQ